MAIQYVKSALAESIIPVIDKPIKSGVSQNIGDLVYINGGEIDAVTLASSLVTTTVTNLGVSEGNNFEGLGVTPKVGKLRVSGNAIYKAPYGAVGATGGFTAFDGTDEQWKALVGTTKAIGKNTLNDAGVLATPPTGNYARGFVVDSAGAVKLVKITDVDKKDGVVYFQFLPSTLYTS
jgi:hypothetical protein